MCAGARHGGIYPLGNPKIGGINDSGQRWIMYDMGLGGYGGRSNKDGVEGLAPVMNCANVPVEVHETHRLFLLIASKSFPTFCVLANIVAVAAREDIELLCENATVVLSRRPTNCSQKVGLPPVWRYGPGCANGLSATDKELDVFIQGSRKPPTRRHSAYT